jgi:hypothetical protein
MYNKILGSSPGKKRIKPFLTSWLILIKKLIESCKGSIFFLVPLLTTRIGRFFVRQYTKTEKKYQITTKLPNEHKIHAKWL